MSAQQRDMVDAILRESSFDLGGDVATHRSLLEEMLTAPPLAGDVEVAAGELGGVAALFVGIAGSEPAGTLLHLHGGGFAMGSARGSVGLAADLSRRTGMQMVTLEYRLAPEHPYPAALDDVTAAYTALLGRPDGPGRMAVSGESAGGNLAVELLIAGRDRGLAMPVAVLLMSPMTDLSAGGPSFTAKAGIDPNITAQAVRTRARDYIGEADPTDPRFSPVFADLTGLPPMLIQVGSHEVLLSDAVGLAGKAADDDVAVILDVTPGVPHVFQAFGAMLDEGDAALGRAAAFLLAHLAGSAVPARTH